MTTDSLTRLLSSVVKAEMNMLYTEPPFMTSDGLDFGLFCREHAYHTYFLCRLNGYPVEIKLGHYFVLVPGGLANLTLDTGADHAWCASGELRPIDLSMTFDLVDGFPDLLSPVLGTGQNGPYSIHYYLDEGPFRKYVRELPESCCICYLEQESFSMNDEALLENPFSFFLPPATQGGSLADVHGSDISEKITLHLYKVALGHVKPLYRQMDSDEAVVFIKYKYPEALPRFREELRKNA